MTPDGIQWGIALLIIASIVAATGALSPRQSMYRISLIFGICGSASLVVSSLTHVLSGTAVSLCTYPITGVISISFGIERLSGIFVLLLSLVSIACSIYTFSDFTHEKHRVRVMVRNALMFAFLTFMTGVLLSWNSILFLAMWELMAITSFLLVMYSYEKEETRRAGMYYLAMTQLSTIFLMAGFLYLFSITNTFDLRGSGIPTGSGDVIFLLLVTGFMIKAGIIPFHKWLPYAHPAAPSVISALMSGVMLTVAIYGILLTVLSVLSPESWWGWYILIFGLVSSVLGIMYAMKESDIKVLLAYSSIENMGIILIGIGLYLIFSLSSLTFMANLALIGSLFHACSHGVVKSLLFMAAGSIVHSAQTRDLDEMGGLIHTMPMTAVIFFTGSLTISAIPPLCCFIGELLIFQSIFYSFHEVPSMMRFALLIILSVFAFVSAMSAACFVKAFGIAFLGLPRSIPAEQSHEAPIGAVLGPGLLGIIAVLSGVFSYQILSYLGYPDYFPDMSIISLILLVSIGCIYLLVRFPAPPLVRTGDTWDCGIRSPAARIEYTSIGFSEPLITIFSSLFRTRKIIHKNYEDPDKCLFKNGSAEIELFRFFEEYLYTPLSRRICATAELVAKHQNNNLDTYLLYLFVTAVIIIVFMGAQV